MVQLNAAALGASTSNANEAIGQGLAGMTQGLVQGMKLRFMQEQAAREQATYAREDQERKAAQRGIGLLAGEANYRVPDNAAQVAEAQPQIQAGANAVRDVTRGTPAEFMGDMLSRGAMSSSKPLGQAFDWQNLKRHQSEFMSWMQNEVSHMDPHVGVQMLTAAKQGLVEDAKLLARSHAVSQAHDDMVSGAFDAFTPDGHKLRDPEIMRVVSELATQVEHGTLSPEEYEAKVAPLRDQAHASWVENKQRFYLAQSAQRDLDEMAKSRKPLPDVAVSAHHELEVGRYDPKQFKADWPHLLEGKIKYKGEWEQPETVGKLQKLETQLLDAQTQAAQALGQERRATAEDKSAIGRARAFMYERALQQAKGKQAAADHWRESFDKAMATDMGVGMPRRTIAEATEIANAATGLKVAPPANGGSGGPGGPGGPDSPFNADEAAKGLKGVDPQGQKVSIGAIAAKYGDAAALATIKALGLAPEKAAPAKPDKRAAALERLMKDPSVFMKDAFQNQYGDLSEEELRAFYEKLGPEALKPQSKNANPERPPVNSSGRRILRLINGKVVSEEEWQRVNGGR